MSLDELPVMEFAFPGPLRDQLVAAILSGAKTTTSALLLPDEPMPPPGNGSQSWTRPVGASPRSS
jgi:uncharacterized protein YhfF